MGWLKIDDGFADSPKVDNLSDGALRLWVVVACWLRQPEHASLNGFVPAAALDTITRRRWPSKTLAKLAQELVNATVGGLHEHGLWEHVDGGWMFHDWNQFQPITEEPLTPAERGRIGGKKSAESRISNNGTALPVNATNRRSKTFASVASELASVEAKSEAVELASTEAAPKRASEKSSEATEAPSPLSRIPEILQVVAKDLSGTKPESRPSTATATTGPIRCPADLRLTDDQRGALETSMIPGWAIDELTTQYVSSQLADESKTMPLVAWRKCLAKSIVSCWNDSRRRPRKPEASNDQAPESGVGAPPVEGQVWHKGGYWYFPLPEQVAV